MEHFDSISDKIIGVGVTSDARLEAVMGKIFEKSIDEPNFSRLYAKLSHKLQTNLNDIAISINIPGLQSKFKGKTEKGGLVFRTLLLTRCQMEFQEGPKWKGDKLGGASNAHEVGSSDYYEESAIKRRSLGLVRFIGELFKLGMLTLNIIHVCNMNLLGKSGGPVPSDEKLESVCELLQTTGRALESFNIVYVDGYMTRIQDILKGKLTNRTKFMLMDIIDARKAHWPVKEVGPLSLQGVKDSIRSEKEKAEKEVRFVFLFLFK